MGGRSSRVRPQVRRRLPAERVTTRARPFSAPQVRTLRFLLGDRFDTVAPRLEEGVRYLGWGPRHLETYRDRARRHTLAADKLDRHTRRVLETLTEIDPLAREAVRQGVIRGKDPVVGTDYLEQRDDREPEDDASPVFTRGSSLGDLMSPPWASGETARAALENLLSDIQAWREVAGRLARRPGGSGGPVADRRRLNLWVGTVLRDAGFEPTPVRHGRLDHVVRIVDEAAGLPMPKTLFRDLQYVCRRLGEDGDPTED